LSFLAFPPAFSGKAKILDSLREVVALHRERYVFPIRILVSKTGGSGADATFMGLLQARPGRLNVS
jgi:hypothetical protein